MRTSGRILKCPSFILVWVLLSFFSVKAFPIGHFPGVLIYELMSEHPAEYWFDRPKDVEFARAIEWNLQWKMARMLKDGIEINTPSRRGMTFLVYAYLKSSQGCYEFLLKNGADPDQVVILAEKMGKWGVQVCTNTALSMAVDDLYSPGYLGLALKYGGNPNTDLGVHVLYFAINTGNFENVRLLVEAGADIEGREKKVIYSTPLSHCLIGNDYRMAYYLLQKGANPKLTPHIQDDITASLYDYSARFTRESFIGRGQIEYDWMLKFKHELEEKGFDFSSNNRLRIEYERECERRIFQEEQRTKNDRIPQPSMPLPPGEVYPTVKAGQ